MLPEVARQVLHTQAEVQKFADVGVLHIAAGLTKVALRRILRVLVFPGTHQAR